MKKLIGLYHCQKNNTGEWYNFYPVLVLTDMYRDNKLGLYDIEWDDRPDLDIEHLCPNYQNPIYRFINISCLKEFNNGYNVFNSANDMWEIPTWGVLDVDFALDHLKLVDENKGKYAIPFIDIEDKDLSITGNDCYLVIGRKQSDTDLSSVATYFDYYSEQFLIFEGDNKFTGPYITRDAETIERDAGYASWIASETSHNMAIFGIGNDYAESYDIQVILKESLNKVSRGVSKPAAEKELFIEHREEPLSEPSSAVLPNETIEQIDPELNKTDDAIEVLKESDEVTISEEDDEKECELSLILKKHHGYFPSDYEFGSVVEDIPSKATRECQSTAVIKDFESNSATASAIKHAFSELNLFNAVRPEMVNALLTGKGKRNSENAFAQLYRDGYVSKVTIDGIGDYYRASKRGLKVFEFEKACKNIGIKKGRDSANEVNVNNPQSYSARIAYTYVVADIYKNVSNERGSFNTYSNTYIAVFTCKNGLQNAVLGIFDSDYSKEVRDYQDRLSEILAQETHLVRLIIPGISKEHAIGCAKSIIEYYKDLVPDNVIAYSLEEKKYYDGKTSNEMSIEEVWNKELDASFKEKEAIKAVELANIKKEEETAKRIAEEENKRKKLEEEAKERIAIALKEAEEAEKQKAIAVKELNEVKQLAENSAAELESTQADIVELRKQAGEIIRNARKAIESPEFARVTIDGYLASQMMKSAAEWEAGQKTNEYFNYCNDLNNLEEDKIQGSLLNYVVEKVKKARPSYSANEIINIAICVAQSFITVLAGRPGSGKTSISNIFAEILGLNIPVGEYTYNRYIPISVGRGWTSQRDFIGYYNPLSKEFDTSNKQAFDAFKIGNEEYGHSKYPLFILLDEANLSPMEHYWSEFIRICDDRTKFNSINCGGKEEFKIPDTMRFLATINNDDTTTTLSPRMIDRAWIITLPTLIPEDLLEKGREFEDGELLRITWKDFYDTFGPRDTDSKTEKEVMELLKTIIGIVPGLNVNYRVYKSILEYYSAAKHCFDNNDKSSNALDFAIAQRILPKIGGVDGQGEGYGKQLEDLYTYLKETLHYDKSAALVRDIIDRGKDIGYYQFF